MKRNIKCTKNINDSIKKIDKKTLTQKNNYRYILTKKNNNKNDFNTTMPA